MLIAIPLSTSRAVFFKFKRKTSQILDKFRWHCHYFSYLSHRFKERIVCKKPLTSILTPTSTSDLCFHQIADFLKKKMAGSGNRVLSYITSGSGATAVMVDLAPLAMMSSIRQKVTQRIIAKLKGVHFTSFLNSDPHFCHDSNPFGPLKKRKRLNIFEFGFDFAEIFKGLTNSRCQEKLIFFKHQSVQNTAESDCGVMHMK